MLSSPIYAAGCYLSAYSVSINLLSSLTYQLTTASVVMMYHQHGSTPPTYELTAYTKCFSSISSVALTTIQRSDGGIIGVNHA